MQLDEMWGFVDTREPNLNEGDPKNARLGLASFNRHA